MTDDLIKETLDKRYFEYEELIKELEEEREELIGEVSHTQEFLQLTMQIEYARQTLIEIEYIGKELTNAGYLYH